MPAIWHSAKTVSLAVNRAPPHSSLSLSQSHHSHPPLVARTSPRRAHATRSLPRRPSPLFAGRPSPPHHTHAAQPLPTILRPPHPYPPYSGCPGRRPSPSSSCRHGRRRPRHPHAVTVVAPPRHPHAAPPLPGKGHIYLFIYMCACDILFCLSQFDIVHRWMYL
jgi:hypothetical protein